MAQARTQVGIVGAGPAGLTLALLLQREGIESVVLETRSREYVEHRVRAGLLEQNTVDLLHDLGVGARLDREGLRHTGVFIRHQGRTQHVDMSALTGRFLTVYGQQEVVKDLIAARLERGGELHFEVSIRCRRARARRRAAADHVGCTASSTRSSATSSPAATGSMASAAPRSPRAI